MKKKIVVLAALIATMGMTATAKADTAEKKWRFQTGVSHIERQQGRNDESRALRGYEGPLDYGEDGDITRVFTKIGYKFNEKWSMDYSYSYDFVRNEEKNAKRSGGRATKDDGKMVNHTVRLLRNLEPATFMNKEWNRSMYVGYRHYEESNMRDENSNGLLYTGFNSSRILFNYNMNTQLSEKVALDLNYHYQFRNYDNDTPESTKDGEGKETWGHQHRNWLSATFDFKINDAWSFTFGNTAYIRFHSDTTSDRSYIEWDYDYMFHHKHALGGGYTLVTDFGTWGEVSAVRAGNNDLFDHQQGEVIVMPKIKKTFKLAEDMSVSSYVGAGYVYGYDPNTMRREYAGFEGRFGATLDYRF